MALILQNATFEDAEGLSKIVELYKRKSITAHALSTELTMAARGVIAFGNELFIEIVEENAGAKTFGMLLLPKPTANKMDLFIYIDSALFNLVSSGEIIKMLLHFIANYSKVTVEFAKFNVKNFDFEVDLVDSLTEALRLYKISLEIFSEFNLEEKVNIIEVEEVDKIISELEKGTYNEREAKELVVISNSLPQKLVDAAEDIVKNSRSFANREVEPLKPAFGTEYYETPSADFFYKKIKDNTDGTYPMYQPKEISHDYEPETNQ